MPDLPGRWPDPSQSQRQFAPWARVDHPFDPGSATPRRECFAMRCPFMQVFCRCSSDVFDSECPTILGAGADRCVHRPSAATVSRPRGASPRCIRLSGVSVRSEASLLRDSFQSISAASQFAQPSAALGLGLAAARLVATSSGERNDRRQCFRSPRERRTGNRVRPRSSVCC